MDVIYTVLEFLLPFEFIDYTFMKNALLAILLITPIFAILGLSLIHI